MAFQISPGVEVKEKDLTTIVPAVSTTIAAFAGHFQWGPSEQIVTVDSENNLKALFGEPNADNYEEWFTAANYLGYGNNLKVVRQTSSSSSNASATGGTDTYIKNDDHYNVSMDGLGVTSGQWVARYPGTMGNSLKVVWTDGGYGTGGEVQGLTAYDDWTYYSKFDSTMPYTSQWMEDLTGNTLGYDGLNVAVIDEDGLFTGTKGTVLETFNAVSKAANAKTMTGESNYYQEVINTNSKYIWWGAHPDGGTNSGQVTGGALSWGDTLTTSSGATARFDTVIGSTGATQGKDVSLSGGGGETLGTISTGATQGYGLFADPETVDVSLILGSNADNTLAGALVDLCDSRKDCVVFLSPEKADVITSDSPRSEADAETDVVDFRKTQLNKNSSYAFLDSGWKYMYDRYADLYRWVPLNGDMAGLAVRSDQQTETWFSPAGFNRGQVRGVVKLSWNPRKAHRDNLYKCQVNPVVSFPGEGTVLWGDKTLQSKPSSFDRLNVRRLFIVLEKAISTAAKYQLFEQNDAFTRTHFKSMIEPFLRDVQARRGVTDFKVVCDDSNNTAEVVDRNEFVADIYIKPTRSINFITLNFVATATGVDFTEVGA
jgi:hypothetical protein